MLVLVWILKMASAKIGASDSLIIFGTSYSPYFGGIEFVTITWSNWEFLMFYNAFPIDKNIFTWKQSMSSKRWNWKCSFLL